MAEKEMMDKYGTRLSHLEGQVGGLSIQVQSLSGNMTELGHKIDRIVDKLGEKQPLNWGWIISAALGLGAFVLLYTSPIEKVNNRQDAAIYQLQQDQLAVFRESTEVHTRNNTRLNQIEKELDRIDLYGSRIWATKKHPAAGEDVDN